MYAVGNWQCLELILKQALLGEHEDDEHEHLEIVFFLTKIN